MSAIEGQSPGLIKMGLLSDLGGTSLVYDGLHKGQPVVIKKARAGKDIIPIIQSEYNFLLNPPDVTINANLSDYGIPTDWKVNVRLVRPIPGAVTDAMYKDGTIVLEKIEGKALLDKKGEGDQKIPIKFHFGAIIGWLYMLRKFKTLNITLDMNFDTDLLLSPDAKTKTLNVVRVDCPPIAANKQIWMYSPLDEDRDKAISMEQFVIGHTLNRLYELYVENPHFGFIKGEIQTLVKGYKKGAIHDAETLYHALIEGIKRADWQDTFVKSNDNFCLMEWVGVEFKKSRMRRNPKAKL